jgi:molybdate transport system substrate-binding protein
MTARFALLAAIFVAGCTRTPAPAPPNELHVAAAANLTRVLPELAAAFERDGGAHIVPSFGATAQLAQQIENGAPYDVFLAADTEHVNGLVKAGVGVGDKIYALGKLAIWTPVHPPLTGISDLAHADVRTIVIAKPELAPYGAAAVEALKNAGLWEQIQKKVVYAPSISVAKQFADTGNGDAAFTALALVVHEKGAWLPVDQRLYEPIEQSACLISASKNSREARAFITFLTTAEGQSILKKSGY